MGRRIEVSRHLHRDPRPGRKFARPSHQQLGMVRHPLQGRVAHHHIGIDLRRPRTNVADVRVDTSLARGFHHLR
jgi:hypothetical protein